MPATFLAPELVAVYRVRDPEEKGGGRPLYPACSRAHTLLAVLYHTRLLVIHHWSFISTSVTEYNNPETWLLF